MELSVLLKALGDPTRSRIFQSILQRKHCVRSLSKKLGISVAMSATTDCKIKTTELSAELVADLFVHRPLKEPRLLQKELHQFDGF